MRPTAVCEKIQRLHTKRYYVPTTEQILQYVSTLVKSRGISARAPVRPDVIRGTGCSRVRSDPDEIIVRHRTVSGSTVVPRYIPYVASILEQNPDLEPSLVGNLEDEDRGHRRKHPGRLPRRVRIASFNTMKSSSRQDMNNSFIAEAQ